MTDNYVAVGKLRPCVQCSNWCASDLFLILDTPSGGPDRVLTVDSVCFQCARDVAKEVAARFLVARLRWQLSGVLPLPIDDIETARSGEVNR